MLMTCLLNRAALESLFPLSFPMLTSPLSPQPPPRNCCALSSRRAPSPLVWMHLFYPLVGLPHLLTSPYLLWMSFWFRAKPLLPGQKGSPLGGAERLLLLLGSFWGCFVGTDMPLFTPHLVWCLCFFIAFPSLGNRTAPQHSCELRLQVVTDAFQDWNYCTFSLFSLWGLNVIPGTALEGLAKFRPQNCKRNREEGASLPGQAFTTTHLLLQSTDI